LKKLYFNDFLDLKIPELGCCQSRDSGLIEMAGIPGLQFLVIINVQNIS